MARLTSHYSLVFQSQLFRVLIVPLITQCSIFETTPALLAKPYQIQSRVSIDSFRTFVGAIGGTKPNITGDNAVDLWLLSDKFQCAALLTAIAAWRPARLSQRADARLITASLDERFQSPARVNGPHDEKARRLEREVVELK
jgi:hypothetical protein